MQKSVAGTRLSLLGAAALVALAGMWVVGSTPARAANLEVTTTDDLVYTSTNDCTTVALHTCSLRAAIHVANIASEATVIHVPAGTYTISLFGCPTTDDDSCGDFNVVGANPTTLHGDGVATTFIDGGANADVGDRVFKVGEANAVTTFSVDHLTVRNGNAVRNPSSDNDGGGFEVVNSTLNLTSVVVTANKASNGGGIDQTTQTPQNSGARPASVQPLTATINLADVTVSSNAATDSDGGGIYVSEGTANVVRTTINDNTMADSGEGGGIDVDGTATLTNVTIYNNSAGTGDSTGGGVAVDGTVNLVNSTIDYNSAQEGANLDVWGTANFKNTIVANPQSSTNCFSNDGTFTSQGYNLEFPGTTCVFTGTGDIQGQDPLLAGPPQDNGGETKTQALNAGSPAIDHVDATLCPPPATDQRGISRPQNGKCEIGAFEVVPAVITPSPSPTPTAAVLPALPKAGGAHPAPGLPGLALLIVAILAAPLTLVRRRHQR